MLKIVPSDPRLVEVVFAVEVDMPAVAVVGLDDGRVVGAGGLAWGQGRAWIWFGMIESHPSYAVPIIRATRRMLRRAVQLGERVVWTVRDADQPQSAKLLTLLGFVFSGLEVFRGHDVEVWKWVSSST